jgi:hypothetical protein
LYNLRIDITKRIDELGKKSGQVTHLSQELTDARRKVAELLKKEGENA